MLKEIKKELMEGPTTVEMLSLKFGVSRERMEDAFRLLLNAGLIEEVPLSQDCEGEKGPLCAFCPLAKSCGKFQFRIYRIKS